MRLSVLLSFLAIISTTALASPPPPPPADIAEITHQLTADLVTQNFDSYSAVFADDLRVTMNDHEIASSKGVWLTHERGRLGKVWRIVVGYSEGQNEVLVFDMIDDRSGLPTLPDVLYDPRFITRAARYQLGPDRLVNQIQFLESDAVFIASPHGH